MAITTTPYAAQAANRMRRVEALAPACSINLAGGRIASSAQIPVSNRTNARASPRTPARVESVLAHGATANANAGTAGSR